MSPAVSATAPTTSDIPPQTQQATGQPNQEAAESRPLVRTAEKILTTQGVDSQTAAMLEDQLNATLPADMPLEQYREQVMQQAKDAGFRLADSLSLYSENVADYEAGGYSPQEAASHAAAAAAWNAQQRADLEIHNRQQAQRLQRPRLRMSNKPVKGTGKTLIQRVTKGDSFNAIKGLLKQFKAADKPVAATGTQQQAELQVQQMITQESVVRDADGMPILMDNPDPKGGQPSGILNRVWHLLGKKQPDGTRVYDSRKAKTALSTPTTIRDYHVKVQTASGAIGYIRTYADGTEHAVLVVPLASGMRVVDQGTLVELGLETQYPLDAKGIQGAFVLRNRTANAQGAGVSSAFPSTVGSSSVPGAHGSGSTPTATTNATSASGVDKNIKQSSPNVKPGTRGITAQHVQDAIKRLTAAAPELAGGVRVVANRESLNENDFHPEDWADMDSTEAFFNPRTGEVVVLTDNVVIRPGETPIRAAIRAIVHEQIGHAGLAALRQQRDKSFARRWDALVKSLYAVPAQAVEINAIAQEPAYAHLAGDRSALVEEWFARRVENMTEAQLSALPPSSALGKLWQWLKDALEGLTAKLSRRAWNNKELREIMALSRQALKDGRPVGDAARVKQWVDGQPIQANLRGARQQSAFLSALAAIQQQAKATAHEVQRLGAQYEEIDSAEAIRRGYPASLAIAATPDGTSIVAVTDRLAAIQMDQDTAQAVWREEMIHVAWIAALRADYQRSNTGWMTFPQWMEQELDGWLNELQASPTGAQAIVDAANAYDQPSKLYRTPADALAAFAGRESLIIPELARQLIQLRESGRTTESVIRKALQKVQLWFQAALKRLKAVAADIGQVSPTLQSAIEETERILAAASQPPPNAPSSGALLPSNLQPLGTDQRQRTFGTRVRADERLDPGTRQAMGDPALYDIAHNQDTMAAANALIDQHGLDGAQQILFDESNGLSGHVRVTLGQQLIMRLDKAARAVPREQRQPYRDAAAKGRGCLSLWFASGCRGRVRRDCCAGACLRSQSSRRLRSSRCRWRVSMQRSCFQPCGSPSSGSEHWAQRLPC